MEFLFEVQAQAAEKAAIQQSFNEWRKQNAEVVAQADLQLVAGANKIANCSFNGAMNSLSIKSIYRAEEKKADTKPKTTKTAPKKAAPVAKKTAKK
jgi:hypothetical protein